MKGTIFIETLSFGLYNRIKLKLPKNLKSTLYNFDIAWLLAITCNFFGIVI
jgi:hypothetical protein